MGEPWGELARLPVHPIIGFGFVAHGSGEVEPVIRSMREHTSGPGCACARCEFIIG